MDGRLLPTDAHNKVLGSPDDLGGLDLDAGVKV